MFLEQFPKGGQKVGWIELICGSMFSGKTEELIRRMGRAQFAKQKLVIFKPSIDNRFALEEVVSHKGSAIPALQVRKAKEIIEKWSEEWVVGIDEAQFFDEDLVQVCIQLASRGVRVIVAGLDMDFTGKPFGPIPNLMAVAEYVTKVHAICLSCGNLAQFSHRKTKNSEQVMLGAVDEYEPLCRNCYNQSQKK